MVVPTLHTGATLAAVARLGWSRDLTCVTVAETVIEGLLVDRICLEDDKFGFVKIQALISISFLTGVPLGLSHDPWVTILHQQH